MVDALTKRGQPPVGPSLALARHLARCGRGAAVAVALSLVAASCGDDDSVARASVDSIEVLEAEFVPATLLDLPLAAEDASGSLADVRNSYLEAVRLFGIRDAELLVATLQVGRFNSGADYASGDFREALLQQIGGTKPRRARMGGQTVFLTTGVKQNLTVWFRDRYLFILGTRQEFDRPRSLLREALGIDPRDES